MRPVVRRAVRGMSNLALAAAVAITAMGVSISVGAQEPPPPDTVVAAGGEPVLLREQPGYDAVALATLGGGEAVEVVGAAVAGANGTSWLPVVVAGQNGFLPAGVVSSAAPPPPPSAPVPEAAVAPVTEGGEDGEAAQPPVTPAAEPTSAAAEPVPTAAEAAPDTPLAPPAPAAPSPPLVGTTATTTADVNLRSGPSPDADILRVLVPGTAVAVEGDPVAGYVPVNADGTSGWVAAEYLGDASSAPAAPAVPDAAGALESTPLSDAAVAPEASPVPVPATPSATPPATPTPAELSPTAETPAERERPGTGIVWPFAGGTWHVIQGYNGGTHQNRSSFAQYYYGLDWARVDGDSAGQPVFAPVSGTVRWVDRGSGGLLIDAGNGYGVALFHITLNGVSSGSTVERGQQIGVVSGPGGDGYMSTDHVEIDVWALSEGGHSSTPFVGPNAIAGQEFPDTGGANQHMGARVTP